VEIVDRKGSLNCIIYESMVRDRSIWRNVGVIKSFYYLIVSIIASIL
jgi:hypothetical protein